MIYRDHQKRITNVKYENIGNINLDRTSCNKNMFFEKWIAVISTDDNGIEFVKHEDNSTITGK